MIGINGGDWNQWWCMESMVVIGVNGGDWIQWW